MHHLKMKIRTHSSRLPNVLTWKLWLKTAVNERRGAKKLFVFFSASEISGDPQNTLGTLVAAIFNFLTRAMRWRAHRIVTRIYRYLLSTPVTFCMTLQSRWLHMVYLRCDLQQDVDLFKRIVHFPRVQRLVHQLLWLVQ